MFRSVLPGLLTVALLAGGSAFAANSAATAHPAPTKVSYTQSECTSLQSQYDEAIKGKPATSSKMKTAASLAAQGQSSCNAKKFTRGVAKYESALKTLGVQPKV